MFLESYTAAFSKTTFFTTFLRRIRIGKIYHSVTTNISERTFLIPEARGAMQWNICILYNTRSRIYGSLLLHEWVQTNRDFQ